MLHASWFMHSFLLSGGKANIRRSNYDLKGMVMIKGITFIVPICLFKQLYLYFTREYEEGRPVQWGAFTSTSSKFAAAANFTKKNTGVLIMRHTLWSALCFSSLWSRSDCVFMFQVLFKISVYSARRINYFSFFSREEEVSPLFSLINYFINWQLRF